MLGAIIGDFAGSPFEFDHNNVKTEEFSLFGGNCTITDDSIMTIAVAEAFEKSMWDNIPIEQACIESMQRWGAAYPKAGYGARFSGWLRDPNPKPYNSWGNGSAMRVSSAGWLFESVARTEHAAKCTAIVSHDHPEGIKGAQATAVAIFLARNGESKASIARTIEDLYGYNLHRTLAQIRPTYHHVESCQETVPEAIIAFLESRGFEDAIRKAISIGGDSDTVACITGSIAEAYYGIPEEMKRHVMDRVPEDVRAALIHWRDNMLDLRTRFSAYGLKTL